jgi:lipid-binding SYLF domain-containing protein
MRIRTNLFPLALLVWTLALVAAPSRADDKALIDANTERALGWLRNSDARTAELLEQAAGVLVFPDMVKMGFGVGGEFGEGALVIKGQAVDYYASAGKTFGAGPEADYKAEVIFFMTEESLETFRGSRSWDLGHLGISVPVVSATGADYKALRSSEDMLGVIFSEDGMLEDLQLDGDRITRIVR